MGRLSWLALVLVVAMFLAPSGQAWTSPVLKLADRQPLTIWGRGFKPDERIRVVVKATVTKAKTVRATPTGSFKVRFAGLSMPRCGGVFATARGRAGSFARLKIPLPACQPVTQP
jgi:hypothetical protein